MDNDTFLRMRSFVECLRQFQITADGLIKALEREMIQSGKRRINRPRRQNLLWTEDEGPEEIAERQSDKTDVTIYSPAQLAKVLGIGRSTLYRLLKTGEIPCIVIANRKRILGGAVDEYLRGKLQSSPE
ncbi:MAG: helix-turn-helix domain-containing protein [Negativicutes bacterium]|nr:helix-turn-helix domain-containing protein [Negativicutes bacterium]